jgi:L-methionine (R)-S-oxide reductase
MTPRESADPPLLEAVEEALARGTGAALRTIVEGFGADSGTLHLLGADGHLHLEAATEGIPQAVLDVVRTVPVGKGMAGLAVLRRKPVTACNIQTDSSGDVRPGARATGLEGAIVVPVMRGEDAIGALGIANRSPREFTPAEQDLLIDLGRAIGAGRKA